MSPAEPFLKTVALPLVCFVVAAGLAVTAARRDSVTVDEYALLPGGLAILEAGAYQIDAGVPPLGKVLPAVPAFLSGARVDPAPLPTTTSGWRIGRGFEAANAERYQSLYVRARMVSIAVLLLTWFLTWGYARSLYGATGGLISAAFVCFWPDLLAHGHLVTTDIYLAAATIGTLWAFDAFLRRPGMRSAAVLGAALGLAALAKYTGAMLVPLLVGSALLIWLSGRDRERGAENGRLVLDRRTESGRLVLDRRTIRWGAVALVIGGGVIAAAYGFRWSPWYLKGLGVQLADKGYDAYLLGRIRQTGFWSYYLIGFLVKTPVPAILAVLAALALKLRISRRELPLLVVWLVLLVFFSFAGHKNIGVRYLLFTVPIACVWIGRIASAPVWTAPRWRRSLVALTIAAGLAMAGTAVLACPHYLAYFNFASGGSANGHRYLLDSNLDWGQDLIALREYMKREKIPSVALAYFGRVKPEVYGVNYVSLIPGVPLNGADVAVVSANLLWGRMYFINGTGYWPTDSDLYAGFRALPPRAVLGHTLYVYNLHSKAEGAGANGTRSAPGAQ